ncbi:hypothetical protein [Micromonospora yangpuensis]|uniref:Uncharacterized protein n=1 Tax=Micromonospora yangpuensis TaxID=683228 RepID=A0A1C6VDM2_9ACTN|nr:hypothetical protein [Micromonospora yangpuensis]SCL64469.1 hypothetical protein GA0070617_5480 [Micromonospora yangpuensis]
MTSPHVPAGTRVRLVIPDATVVAHGNLQLQVRLPDHSEIIHLPIVDNHFQSIVEVLAHAPRVAPGQTWRSEAGHLFYAVRWRQSEGDAGEPVLIAADSAGAYTPAQAVADFGQLTLLDTRAVWDPVEPVDPDSTTILPRVTEGRP